MRRLALLPLVMLVFACNDGTLLQPDDRLSTLRRLVRPRPPW